MGDNAETAMIELVDFNEVYGKGIGEEKTAGKKTRRAGSKKKAEATAETKEATPAAEEPAAE
jgi:large subunit ribosomal protein L17